MSYQINKGINRPIEFKGLKAQYIGYLGGGLVILLVLFAIIYLIDMAVYLCILIILGLGSLLFHKIFSLSHKYGETGLMKRNTRKYLPTYLKFKTRTIFMKSAEQVFPIYKVEHDTLLSMQGDLTIAFELTLPELFTYQTMNIWPSTRLG